MTSTPVFIHLIFDDGEESEVDGHDDESYDPCDGGYEGGEDGADDAGADGEEEGDEGDEAGDWVQDHGVGEGVGGVAGGLGEVGVFDVLHYDRGLVADVAAGAEVFAGCSGIEDAVTETTESDGGMVVGGPVGEFDL